MDKVSVSITLQVFFEEPFWVGVAELYADDKLSVCKVTFGAESKDSEVYQYFLMNYHRLRFSPSVETAAGKMCGNPKRMQRKVHKQVNNVGIGNKSQQALKLQQEQMKTERRALGKEQREACWLRRFVLKQQKKKEKHRGR